jgi:hypothetical protein
VAWRKAGIDAFDETVGPARGCAGISCGSDVSTGLFGGARDPAGITCDPTGITRDWAGISRERPGTDRAALLARQQAA